MECIRCGTCCVAPDISALKKPLGVRCVNLLGNCCCSIYEKRPPVCRGYRADDICAMVSAPTLDERVGRYLALFGLAEVTERDHS